MKKSKHFKVLKSGYRFNKWVFRVAVLVLIIIGFVGAAQINFEFRGFSVRCYNWSEKCYNPLYENDKIKIPAYASEKDREILSRELLPRGYEFSTKQSFIVNNYFGIALLTLLLAFAYNHIVFNWSVKK
jgi:hypothetical protein